jgi:hypothetical protein
MESGTLVTRGYGVWSLTAIIYREILKLESFIRSRVSLESFFSKRIDGESILSEEEEGDL